MNKLKGARVYLVGPMDRAKDYGVGWRRELVPFLQTLGLIVLDPTNKPMLNVSDQMVGIAKEEHQYKDAFKAVKDWEGLTGLMKRIRHIDLRLTDITDFLIVRLDMSAAMCGTWEEIFTANRAKKPILIVIEGGKESIPDWMFGVLPYRYFFASMSELREYLVGIDEGEIVMDERWTLLDQARLEV